jgi:hypothetical protein
MPLCTCKHGWSAHEDGERCHLCPCKKYAVPKPPSEQDKQDIVDELHDALKRPDTVLKLKVPEDEIQ